MRVREINYAIFLGLIARVAVSFWSGYWGPSFGGDQDAIVFHMEAVAYSRDAILDQFTIGHIYAYALGVVYWLTTDSIFIGCLLSTFTWLASAYVLLACMRVMEMHPDEQVWAARIYALLPSSVALTSVTMREAYELFFVTLAMYGMLQIYLRGSLVHWTALIGAVAGMAVLHGALFVFGIFMLLGTIVLLSMRGQRTFSVVRLFAAAPVVIWIAVTGVTLFGAVSYNVEEGLDVAVQTYQAGNLHVESRAAYKESADVETPTGLLVYGPIGFLQYMLEPMPWRPLRLVDSDAISENLLRVWLIRRAFIGVRGLRGERRRAVVFLLIAFFALEFVWSLGTVNWGTAIRHHIPSIGVLCVAALAFHRAPSPEPASLETHVLRPNPWHRRPSPDASTAPGGTTRSPRSPET